MLQRPSSRPSKNNILTFLSQLLSVCLFLVSSLISCSASPVPDALQVLLSMIQATPNVAAGDVYLFPGSGENHGMALAEALEIRVRIASEELLRAAFSPEYSVSEQTENHHILQDISDSGACRFSTAASPQEYVVIRCISRADTHEAARLLLHRLNALQKQYRGTDHQALTERGQVIIIGKYVCLVVSPDPDAAIEAARRVITKS